MKNRNYRYSQRSLDNIKTTHAIMQTLCNAAILIANTRKAHCPDFGISFGFRTAQEQFSLFMKGRKLIGDAWQVIKPSEVVTNCDGYDKLSVHQSALAIDFYCYIDGHANYDNANIALVVTCFYEAAADMGIKMNSGLNFKSISDGCHIEVELKT